MIRVEKTVFISYRRTNLPWALMISQSLTHNGFDVFLDYQGIPSGDFERAILENIRARAHFLVLLTPSAVERCDTPGDWFRREIEEALDIRRNIVPLMLEGFDFDAPLIASKLTGKLEMLRRYNGLTVPAEYVDAAMIKLRNRFLNVPLEAVLHPASTFAEQTAKDQQVAAAAAPLVQQRDLTAQEWFERGFNASDLDEKIRCFSEALRLHPDNVETYYHRGRARANKGDFDGVVKDFTAVLRLKPDDVETYCHRGCAHANRGDFDGAVEDFTEALRLKPDDAEIYYHRGTARANEGDLDGAVRDYTMALWGKPDNVETYYHRGRARTSKGDFDGAVEDFTAMLRLKPDDVDAYCHRGSARYGNGDFDGAISDYNEVLRLRPDLVEIYKNRDRALKAKEYMKTKEGLFAIAKNLLEKVMDKISATFIKG